MNASTDLGIAYYYMNQPDRALQQFDRSLAIDPRHTKTLLNVGIVRAFGKDDLQGAAEAWQRVVEYAPESPEGKRAQAGARQPSQRASQRAGRPRDRQASWVARVRAIGPRIASWCSASSSSC